MISSGKRTACSIEDWLLDCFKRSRDVKVVEDLAI